MVGLAVSLQVSVVALHQAATVEGGCRGRGEGGIVLTWSSGDGALWKYDTLTQSSPLGEDPLAFSKTQIIVYLF